MVDQAASIGALPVAVARACGHQVAYLPGLVRRRLADLHPGTAKTDARDAYVIADAARTLPHTLRRVDTGDEARVHIAGIELCSPPRRRPTRLDVSLAGKNSRTPPVGRGYARALAGQGAQRFGRWKRGGGIYQPP